MPREVRTHLGGDGGDGPGDDLAPESLTKEEFGRRVYRLMRAKGMIQSELARRADLPRDSVSVYVRGKSLPTPASLDKLAKALGVAPEELLPNRVEGAMSHDIADFEIKGTHSRPGVVWFRFNRLVTTEAALQITEILKNDKATDRARSGSKT